jgi:hypothetical protein
MPMILRFDLLIELLSFCMFLSQLLSLLSNNSSVLSLISVLFLSPEVLSFAWSSWLGWLSTLLFIWFKEYFTSRISVLILFSVFHIFVKFLFRILCCLLYFICLFFHNFLSFVLELLEVLSELVWLFMCLLVLFICVVLILFDLSLYLLLEPLFKLLHEYFCELIFESLFGHVFVDLIELIRHNKFTIIIILLESETVCSCS